MSSQAIKVLGGRVRECPCMGSRALLYLLMIRHREGEAMAYTVSAWSRELGAKRDNVARAFKVLCGLGMAFRSGDQVWLSLGEVVPIDGGKSYPQGAPERGSQDSEGGAPERGRGVPRSGAETAPERGTILEERKKTRVARAPAKVIDPIEGREPCEKERDRFRAAIGQLVELRSERRVDDG